MRAALTRSLVVTVFLTLAGCGRTRAALRQESPPPPPKPAAAHEIVETTVRFADPKGRWKFQLQADRVEAATMHGPYDMTPAKGRYDELGKTPVTISAKHAHVDEETRRVNFEGDVHVESAAWRLRADRLDYDLNTGKVFASGQTKSVFVGESAPGPQPPSAPKDGKP